MNVHMDVEVVSTHNYQNVHMDWRRIGGGLEEDWRWIGGGLEEDWRRIGGGFEDGMEEWRALQKMCQNWYFFF